MSLGWLINADSPSSGPLSTLIVIPGFGQPHFQRKCEILENNLRHIEALSQLGPVAVRIFCYADVNDPDVSRLLQIQSKYAPLNVSVTFEKGIIGHFLVRHITPEYLRAGGFHRVVLLLDDVEIERDLDWTYMEKVRAKLGLDIVSPCLARRDMSYWPCMAHMPSGPEVKIMAMLELFCYYMTARAYERYWSFLDAENPWMWGCDFIIESHMHLRAGLLNRLKMHHYFNSPRSSTMPNAATDSARYLERLGTTWPKARAYAANGNKSQDIPRVEL